MVVSIDNNTTSHIQRRTHSSQMEEHSGHRIEATNIQEPISKLFTISGLGLGKWGQARARAHTHTHTQIKA